MNNLRTRMFLFGVFIILTLLFVSCSRAATPNASTSDIGDTTEVEKVGQESLVEEGDVQIEGTGDVITSEQELGLPEDVPVPPGHRKLMVTPDGSNVSFEIDGTIEDVVTYYQEELINNEWEMSRSPDKVYSGFGSVARTNEAGDRITISLQYNPIGEFVVVRMVIIRSP